MGKAPPLEVTNDVGTANSIAAGSRPIWVQAITGIVMAVVVLTALAIVLRQL